MHTDARKWIAFAAASVLAAALPAMAQYQVDRSGANDANTRAGSGGRNVQEVRQKFGQQANDIVYGNVTSGKEFRGNVGSRDPFAFRGSTAGLTSDNFVRDSAGVTTNGYTSYNSQNTRQFLGDSRAVNPPAGFVQVPGSGGYVPPRPSAWRDIDPRQASPGTQEYLYRSDQFNMAGPVDTVYNPSAVNVPPVFQARPLNSFNASDYTNLNQDLQTYLSPEQIQNLRNELTNQGQSNNAVNNAVGSNAANANNGQPQKAGGDSAAQRTDQLNNRVATSVPQSATLDNSVAANAVTGDRVEGADDASTGVSQQLIPAAGQSAIYAKLLERRKAQLGDRPGTDAQAQSMAAADLRRQQAAKKAQDDQPTPKPDDKATPTPNATPNSKPDAADKTPMKVTTLSSEKGAAALNEVMKKAEGQLREGKFTNALDTYEAAERAAPNNPLIKLGKAHAELGGGFYRRAEGDLRTTFSADQNLLAGQYDLRGFLGDDRLQIVEKDLREQIQKNEADAGPAILLAYVYYNTSNERRAAALLDLADKRAGGKDAFVKLLKQNWALPAIENENK